MAQRLLIVDDEHSIRVALADYFRTLGYSVDCAGEAEEAQALLVHVQYDVIIADLRLTSVHGAEGLEIVGYVRERCPWSRIVLMTAFGSPELEAEALRQGADRFLNKLQPLSELAAAVRELAGPPEPSAAN